MQRNRIINRTLIAVHRNECTNNRIHISRTEIVKSCYGVKLLACKEEVVFRTANAANKVAECVIDILVCYIAAFVSQRTNRAVSVVNIVRLLSVTFLRNKLIATCVETLLRIVIIKLRKHIGKRTVNIKQILSVFALGNLCNTVNKYYLLSIRIYLSLKIRFSITKSGIILNAISGNHLPICLQKNQYILQIAPLLAQIHH